MADPHDPLDRFEQCVAKTLSAARPRVEIGSAKQRLLRAAARRDSLSGRSWTRHISLAVQWRVLLPAVVTAATAVLMAAVLFPSQTMIGNYTGGVSAFRPILTRWTTLGSDEIPGDVLLRTGGESAELTLRDGSVLSLAAGARFRLFDREGVAVEMHRGRLEARVQPQPKGKSFRVLLPGDVEIEVIGTHFAVTVEDAP